MKLQQHNTKKEKKQKTKQVPEKKFGVCAKTIIYERKLSFVTNVYVLMNSVCACD